MRWFKAAGVRAIKTAAQTAIGVIGATTLMNEVDWYVVGGTVLLATITSFLTSLAGLPEVESSEKSMD